MKKIVEIKNMTKDYGTFLWAVRSVLPKECGNSVTEKAPVQRNLR